MRNPVMIAAVALSLTLLLGQNPSPTRPKLAEGEQSFGKQCAGCHGADAHGSDRGPGLAGNRRVRSRSAEQLRTFIRKGSPGGGMPPFDLPADELESLADWLHSLNAPAAQSAALGDAEAGKRFFEGKGNCASCHMVSGGGRAIGPDLSNAGNEMTVEEIRAALLSPSAHIAPGHELATVRLRNGETIRGFVKSRGGFDLAMMDLEGRFHSLQESEISAIEDEEAIADAASESRARTNCGM